MQKVLHAPVIANVLHVLTDRRKQTADKMRHFCLLCPIRQRASTPGQSDRLQCQCGWRCLSPVSGNF